MPSFSNDANGHSPLYYIKVTLTNSQSSASSTNFQARVTIDSSTNSTYYASNLSNVNFQDGSGNILSSWLESGETNSSTSTVYWINLGTLTVPASGTLDIYQVLYGTSDNSMDGTITGAEPNYTGTYAQYDSGSSVFSKYTNFDGTSIPTDMSMVTKGQDVASYNNSLIIDATGTGTQGIQVYFTNTQTTTSADLYVVTHTAGSLLNGVGIGINRSLPATSGDDQTFVDGYRVEANYYNNTYRIVDELNGSGRNFGNIYLTLTDPFILSIDWVTQSNYYMRYNYNTYYNYTITGDFSPQAGYWGVWFGDVNSTTNSTTFQWFRLRVTAPNGIMPTNSEGTITSIEAVSTGTTALSTLATLRVNNPYPFSAYWKTLI